MYYANITHGRQDGAHLISTDTRVSLKARGLWFTLWWLSVPDDVEDEGHFALAEFIRNYSGDGLAATQGAFRELKRYGYIVEDRIEPGVRYYTLYERG